MDQGWAALLGALVGGGLTAGTAFSVELFKHQTAKRNLAVAVAGEAFAVAELVRRRAWLPAIAGYIDAAKHGAVHRLVIHLPPTFLAASREAVKNSGLLGGHLPGLLPRLVMYADGIASDLARLAEYDPGHPRAFFNDGDAKSAEELYRELFGMVESALRLCDQIVVEVRRLYPDVRIEHGTSGSDLAEALAAATAERGEPPPRLDPPA